MTAQRVVMVVDMQNGVFATPRLARERCVAQINRLVRAADKVIFIQHDEAGGLEAGSEGFALLPELEQPAGALYVTKTACDAFYHTSLAQVLDEHDIQQFVICGCATDYCLDTTIKNGASRGYVIVIAEDAHTTADRPAAQAARLSRIIPVSLTLLAAMALSACTSQQAPALKEGEKPVDVASVVRQKMPASVKDREAWAQAIATAFDSQKLAPTEENVCSVLAVAQQESNYQSDPVVPGLNKIAWQEIDRRAEKMHIPPFLVHTALKITSPNGKSYSDRLDNVKTEKQLSAIFDDFIGMVPMGQKLFGSLNPVHTGGPMQVSIAFAEQHTSGYPWKMNGTVRQEVFSLRGGLWFGTYHLLNYPASYSAPLYRFADFNAGWYASRNAAFQNAVVKASGVKLALDGDLIRYDSEEPGSTELAVRRLASQLGMSDSEIHRQLKKGDSLAFEKTDLYQQVFRLAEKKTGKTLPREMLPGIQLESPKITRNLTTAWFAKRVDERRANCMARR